MSLPLQTISTQSTADARRLRLLVAIRDLTDQATHFVFDNELKDRLLSNGFSHYEVHNHMAWLKSEGLVNVDRNTGRHYPAGTQRLQEWAVKKNTNFNFSCKRFSVVKVENGQWSTKKAWSEFAASVKVSKICTSIQRKNAGEIRRKVRSMTRAQKLRFKVLGAEAAFTNGRDEFCPEDFKPTTQVSISCIQTHFPVARSTASRWRSLAAKGGYVTNQQQFEAVYVKLPDESMTQVGMKWQDYLASRSDIAKGIGIENADRLVLRNEKLFIQHPNIVEPTGKLVIRSRKSKAA